MGHSQKRSQKCKSSKEQQNLVISVEMNQARPVFNPILHLEILKIYQEEQRLTKHCTTKHLRLLVIHRVTDVDVHWLQWFTNSLIRRLYRQEQECSRINRKFRKFQRRKVCSSYPDNIWGADFAGMQLRSKYNKGIRFLLCVIDIYSKYFWDVPLKEKKYYNH